MDRTRAALFLDFDNVFGGLHQLDPAAALVFAERPEVWLARLADELLADGARRWLVLRCYLNPSGSVGPAAGTRGNGEPGPGRVYFSRFRDAFTRAGFEVVDCPRLTHTKNAADIRMVLDAADLVTTQPRCEEFVIASGDCDMTPLLYRLRAADRRTTVVSPSDAAQAFTAVADRLVGPEEVLSLVLGEREPAGAEAAAVEPPLTAQDRARALITSAWGEADEPLDLSRLAAQVVREVPESRDESVPWFGAASFRGFLEALALPGARFAQHHLWDARRHRDPDAVVVEPLSVVDEVSSLLGLPRLPRESWRRVHEVLAEYAASHVFGLTECTAWTRDRLAERGAPVGRAAVGVVVRGVAHGGAPLHVVPPPDAERIAGAFVDNLVGRAAASDRRLTSEEQARVREWFGG